MIFSKGENKMKHKIRISFVVAFLMIGVMIAGIVAAESLLPSPRGYVSIAYDQQSRQVVLFGGQTGPWPLRTSVNGETWAYDVECNTWEQLFPKKKPNDKAAPALAYDEKSDRVIMFGGGNTGLFGFMGSETWAYNYNANTWKKMAYGPRNYLGTRLVYDSESDRMILFGGLDVMGWFFQDGIWAFDDDSNTWTETNPVVSPPGRNFQAMTYDSKVDRVLTWGGMYLDESPLPESMWAYDYNTDTWAEFPAVEPFPQSRDYAAMVYDVESDRTILFGGVSIADPEGEVGTWAYDYNTHTWQEMKPAIEPPFVSRHAMVYSVATDRVILFGGELDDDVPFTYTNEIWAYDYNSNTWENLTP
jgi:N-acetylneuraminic acid mutarotase